MVSKSKQVRYQNANAEFVTSSVKTHGEAIARQLAWHNEGLPAEAKLPEESLIAVVRWLGATLDNENRTLAAAEMRYIAEQADDEPVRVRRDQAAASLLTMAIQVRERVDAHLGGPGLASYGLAGNTPRSPAELASHVQVVIDLLGKSPVQLVNPVAGDFDSATVAQALADGLAPLEEALKDMAREKRELESSLVDRNQALADWNVAYRGVGMALTGLYLLAGEEELAQRIKPTVRRTSGEELPPEITPDDAGAPAPITPEATAPEATAAAE